MNCRVAERFFHVYNLLQEEMRQPRDYGNGFALHHSEVAFLDVIHRIPHANVSRISTELGLTKGAVTQAYHRLSQKGLIELYRREGNKKEKYFRLSEQGELARRGHQRFHEHANKSLCHYFATLTEGETQVIFDFLDQLKQCVPFCEFPCTCAPKPKEDEHEPDNAAGQRAACCAGNRR